MENCREIKIPLIKNKESINEANIILLQQKVSALTEKLDSVETELIEVKKAISKNDYSIKIICLLLGLILGLIIIYHR
ncbi:MAG: hypothetical protein ACRC51_00625 [Cetobacterium sp.]